MSQEQKSIKDLYDLLLEMSGGGATTQDVVDAIKYISYNQTYSLKTVVSQLSQSNTDTNTDLQIALGQLFSGDDAIFGKSLLYDANSSQTAAQLLASITNILQTVLIEGGATAAQLLTLIEYVLQNSYNELVNITGYTSIIQNVYTELTTISANTAFTERLTKQFNYRAFMDSALIPAAGMPAAIQFSGSAGFAHTVNNFVKVTVQNRSDRDLIVYDSVSNPLLYITAGTSEDITGLVSLNSTYPEIYVARASGGVATGNLYLNLVYSLTAI